MKETGLDWIQLSF